MMREGPGNERWLIGRHVDRILEATTAPLVWENLDRRVWLTAMSHGVTALAHIAAPYATPETRTEWDVDVKKAATIEAWLALFGDVYQVLADAGMIGYGRTPHGDASEFFDGLMDHEAGSA